MVEGFLALLRGGLAGIAITHKPYFDSKEVKSLRLKGMGMMLLVSVGYKKKR